MLQRSGGNQQIGAVVADAGRKQAPAASHAKIHRQQAIAIQPQQLIQPASQLRRMGR